ncbi:hypothetical protein [Paenibacillus sp. FSL R7-0026]|uniref:hypothetical protein n=1 Tax=Paenibacillus sp. FSL R7-0026 TaxID=2921668 RepID=UPI0030F4B856
MKRFKKSLLAFSVVAALTSVSSVSAFAAESPSRSAIIVDSSLPEITPFTEYLPITEGKLTSAGNSWNQKAGYDYARVYISNTQSQTLNVYISYNLNGNKQNIWTGTVSANSSKTILVTHASGQTFNVDYNTANGTVSGSIEVRASDVPFG